MSRRFIVSYMVALHIVFFVALGVIGALFGAGVSFRAPSVRHEFVSLRNADKWGDDWDVVANGRDPDIEFGRLRDRSGDVFLIYMVDENDVVQMIETMPSGHPVRWSVARSAEGSWGASSMDMLSTDYDRESFSLITNFKSYLDWNADGVPDYYTDKSDADSVKYRLVDEPWVPIED